MPTSLEALRLDAKVRATVDHLRPALAFYVGAARAAGNAVTEQAPAVSKADWLFALEKPATRRQDAPCAIHGGTKSINHSGTDMTPCSRLILMGALLAGLAGMAQAAPTDYVIQDFTVEEGKDAPTAARFTYDPDVGFSAFTVTWRGTTFDLTSSANQPYGFTQWGTHADSFAMLSKTLTGVGAEVHWAASNDCGTECFGPGFSFSTDRYDASYVGIFTYYTNGIADDDGKHSGRFTVTAVPEADALAMLSAGLATVAWLRRRGPSNKKGA